MWPSSLTTTPALAYSYRQVFGFFQVLQQNVERLDQRLNVPVHGRCGERRSPKVQPSTRPGFELGTSWLAVRDLTNCTNLAHTRSYWLLITVHATTLCYLGTILLLVQQKLSTIVGEIAKKNCLKINFVGFPLITAQLRNSQRQFTDAQIQRHHFRLSLFSL